MTRNIIIGIAAVVLLGVVGTAAYILRPTADPSAPIEAIPLETNQTEMTEEGGSETEMEASSQDVKQDESSGQQAGNVVFEIVPEESKVRFSLDELLRGVLTTVVGTTGQVAGEIAVDFDDPANAQVGTILINARSLVTDNNFRNRAINNEILDTGVYEFITFAPTAILGFPEDPQFGEPLSFQIVGELTIRDVTNEVTFEVTATADSESIMRGYASAMVARADYGLEIPEVPSVANVDEEVLLEIEFIARSK